MKKLLVVVVLLLVVSAMSFAATTTATATATVNAATGLSKTADLAIPNVNQGGTAQQLATDAGAAAFTVTGTANIPTTVTFGYPANLTNGGNNLPFTALMPGYNALGALLETQAGQTAFGALAGGTVNSSTVDGTLYLWVGGKVVAGASQAAGSYSGTITVTVTQ